MRGFEDVAAPVRLYLHADAGLGPGPFDIDGAKAELTADGIRADVGDTRYFVPLRLINRIEQKQAVAPAPQAPQQIPVQARDKSNDPPGQR